MHSLGQPLLSYRARGVSPLLRLRSRYVHARVEVRGMRRNREERCKPPAESGSGRVGHHTSLSECVQTTSALIRFAKTYFLIAWSIFMSVAPTLKRRLTYRLSTWILLCCAVEHGTILLEIPLVNVFARTAAASQIAFI